MSFRLRKNMREPSTTGDALGGCLRFAPGPGASVLLDGSRWVLVSVGCFGSFVLLLFSVLRFGLNAYYRQGMDIFMLR